MMPPPVIGNRKFDDRWLILALALVLFVLVGAADLYQKRSRVTDIEQKNLIGASKVVQVDLDKNLTTINDVLKDLQTELSAGPIDPQLSRRLEVLVSALPSVRTLNVNDAKGTIVASSRAELIGVNKNFTDRDYFKEPKERPSVDTLYVSTPFKTVNTNVFSIAVTRMVTSPSGGFGGVVVATLDPDYYLDLLDTLRYQPDMYASLAHGDGGVFLMVPREMDGLLGTNLAKPGSLFLRHKNSGQDVSVITDTMLATQELRMLVQRSFQPAGLKMDKPLYVAVSRSVSDIYALWWHDLWARVAYFLAIALVASLGLYLYLRKTESLMASEAAARHKLAVSEGFLRGVADNIPGLVAYWDTDLRCTFSNSHYLAWFGKSAQQMSGMHLRDLLGDTLFEENKSYVYGALQGQLQGFERTLTKTDGSIAYTWAQYIPDLQHGIVQGFFVLVSDITPMKHALQDVLKSEARLRRAELVSNSGNWELQMATHDLYCSAGALTLYGHKGEKFDFAAAQAQALPQYRDALDGALKRLVEAGEPYDVEFKIKVAGTGDIKDIHSVAEYDATTQTLFGVMQDITTTKQIQHALAAQEQFARTTLDAIPENICVIDATGTILNINRAWRNFYDHNFAGAAQTGYGLGMNYLAVCHTASGPGAQEAAAMEAGLQRVITGEEEFFELEYPCDSPAEKRFFVARVTRFHGDSGHVLISHENITSRKRAERELELMATTDSLTGLANRRQFMVQAENERARTVRYGGQLSVLALDLDYFKTVNDSFGHQAGDLVLQQVARVCRESLREIDLVGRIGGEEFSVLLPQTSSQQAMNTAQRIRHTLANTQVTLEDSQTIRFTVSVGVATMGHDVVDLDTLLDHADQALYAAKRAGRNRVCCYQPGANMAASP